MHAHVERENDYFAVKACKFSGILPYPESRKPPHAESARKGFQNSDFRYEF